MALTYSSLVSEIATLTVISSTVLVSGDNNFSGIMDGIIDYAEGRLYRDLDLLSASVTDTPEPTKNVRDRKRYVDHHPNAQRQEQLPDGIGPVEPGSQRR